MDKSKYGSVPAKWERASVLIALVVSIFTVPQGACYQRAGLAPLKNLNISGSAQGKAGTMVVNIPSTSGYENSNFTYSLSDGLPCPPQTTNKYQTTGSVGVLYNYVTLRGNKYPIKWEFLSYSETPLGGITDYTDYYTASQRGYLLCTNFDGTGQTGQEYTTPEIRGVTDNLPSDLPPGVYNITGHGYFGVYSSAMTANYSYPDMVNKLLKGGWSTLKRVDFKIPVEYDVKCGYSGILNFDYKTITIDKVSEARLERSVTINCNADVNARFEFRPAKPPSGRYGVYAAALGMGEHLDALIDFDGIDNGGDFFLPKGGKTFKVSSTLKSVNGHPVAGSYQGEGTVVINFF